MSRAIAAVAVCLVALVASRWAAAASRAEVADAALDRGLAELVALAGGPPGAIAVVQRGERIAIHRAGVGDVAAELPPDARDHMRLASVSKAYSGAVALALVARGSLALDDSIGERLPDLPATWSSITLRQLLNHTSGLPDYLATAGMQARLAADPTAYIPPEELLPYIYDVALRFPPGTRYEYSNSDNVVVAFMAEAAGNRSYDALLAELVLAPLRLTETTLASEVPLPTPYVRTLGTAAPGPAGARRVR